MAERAEIHVEPWRRSLARWSTIAVLALWLFQSSVLTIQTLSEYRVCPGHLSLMERGDVPNGWQATMPICASPGDTLGPFHVGIAYPWGKSATLRVLIADRDLCPMGDLDISKVFAQAQSKHFPPNVFAHHEHLRLRKLSRSGPFVVSLVGPGGGEEEFVVAFRRVKQPVRMFADRSAMLRARRTLSAHSMATVLLFAGVAFFRVGLWRPGALRVFGTLCAVGLIGAGLLLSMWLVY